MSSPLRTAIRGGLVALIAAAAVGAVPASAPAVPAGAAPPSAVPDPAASRSLADRPISCGKTFNGRFAIHVNHRTGCAVGRAAYKALRAYARSPEGGFVGGSPKRFRIEIVVPERATPVPVVGRAVPRAHGEFDFTFIDRRRGLSIRYDNLTLP